MSERTRSWLGLGAAVAAAGAAGAFLIVRFGGPAKADAPKPAAPAQQTRAVKEGDLNVVALTPEAEARLGVRVEPVAARDVNRPRSIGGEVVLPSGRAVTVSAPLAGTVAAAAGDPVAPGRSLTKGQPVFTLAPMLTNEARATLATTLVDAGGQAQAAEVQLRAAGVALARAKQLVADQAGSRRAVDEAQAQHDLAGEAVKAAAARRDLLTKTLGGGGDLAGGGGEAAAAGPALTIAAPAAGVVRGVFVAPGQLVSAGAPLFEVVNQDVVWVRAPVYAGELGDVDPTRPATVVRLGAAATQPAATARAVAAPAAANAAGATTDLFYELDNASAAWVPGQRVTVAVPLKRREQGLVVPWSAVVHDVNGGQWVYEAVGPHKYARRRVQVDHVADGTAVLAGGPAAGTGVVTAGVAELFSFEMGFAK